MNEGLRDHFRCFSRNDRWGTCVDCPRDRDKNVYPEACDSTDRYDHNMTVDELVDLYHKQEFFDKVNHL